MSRMRQTTGTSESSTEASDTVTLVYVFNIFYLSLPFKLNAAWTMIECCLNRTIYTSTSRLPVLAATALERCFKNWRWRVTCTARFWIVGPPTRLCHSNELENRVEKQCVHPGVVFPSLPLRAEADLYLRRLTCLTGERMSVVPLKTKARCLWVL